jgi:CRP-like cAMP-binding protein
MRIPRTLFLKMLEGYPDAANRLREDIQRRAEASSRDITKVRGALGAVDTWHQPDR